MRECRQLAERIALQKVRPLVRTRQHRDVDEVVGRALFLERETGDPGVDAIRRAEDGRSGHIEVLLVGAQLVSR
jgi:hypothetical protein